MGKTYRRNKNDYKQDRNTNYMMMLSGPDIKIQRKPKDRRANNNNKNWRQEW